MSKLGDFLERLHGPRDYFTTVQAKFRYWRDRLYADLAADACTQRLAALVGTEAPPAQHGWTPKDGSRECVSEIRVWLEGTDRAREQIDRVAGEGWAEGTWILNGNRRWLRDREQTRRVHLSRGLTYAGRHFGRVFLREIFASLDLEETGSVERLGVECVRVLAAPIPNNRMWSHWFPYGAAEYELHLDPERVAVLAVIAGFDRGVFETNEATVVTYDKPINQARFTIPKRRRG